MLGFLAASTLTVTALTGAAWFVIPRWLPPASMGVVLVAGGANLLAAWIAFVPMVWVHKNHASYLPQATMASMALRMMIVASVLVVASLLGPWNTWTLAVWLLMYYFCLLVVETAFAVRLVQGGRQTSEGSSR